jgi:hypothetical protein
MEFNYDKLNSPLKSINCVLFSCFEKEKIIDKLTELHISIGTVNDDFLLYFLKFNLDF